MSGCLFPMQDEQSSGADSSSSSMNWQPPPLPGGYPWPTPPPMSVMPPMGVRPPMMFGPLPAGFPPARLMQPPRLPLNAGNEGAGKENQETGVDGEIGKSEGSGEKSSEENLQQGGDNIVDVPHVGNFPRPMGCGDWRMRGPPPFMPGPNMPGPNMPGPNMPGPIIPRPDMMRGPRSLLGEGPGPRGFPGVPPAGFGMPQNFPIVSEEEGEEYGEEEGGEYEEEEAENEGEWNEEEENEEEEYNEECEEFPFDGNGDLFAVYLHH